MSEAEALRVLAADEVVARFIYDSDKVGRNGRVQSSAFLPMYEAALQRWETSVCRLNGCTDARVWHLARTARSDRSIKARADIGVAATVAASLSCVEAPVDDFPEHAVILGWPVTKPEQKALALLLSKKAVVALPPLECNPTD